MQQTTCPRRRYGVGRTTVYSIASYTIPHVLRAPLNEEATRVEAVASFRFRFLHLSSKM
jgi:hypothetical protein